MKKICLVYFATFFLFGLTGCTSLSTPTSGSKAKVYPNTFQQALWGSNPTDVWRKVQLISTPKLALMQSKTTDPIEIGWLQLAIIIKQKNISNQQIATELLGWRARYPSHPANQLLPNNTILTQLQASASPKQIAVLLPQSGAYGASAETIRAGFLNAYYANSRKAPKQRVKFYDTAASSDMAALYQEAINDGADFVIGPLAKDQVQQLRLSGHFTTATLALNYTTGRNGTLPPNFFEFGLLPEDEAGQIATRAREAGLGRAIIIAPKNAWGERLATAFSSKWQAQGGAIQETWYFADRANFNADIARLLNVNTTLDKKLMKEDNDKNILKQQRRQDFDVIFLFSPPEDARLIVPLLRFYYANDIPVYATSSVYYGKPNQTKDVDLNGVIVCDIPWNAKGKIRRGISSARLYAVGEDAYQLSQSLSRLTTLPHFPLYATTGALSLSPQQQIHRRLPCVAIRNGLM